MIEYVSINFELPYYTHMKIYIYLGYFAAFPLHHIIESTVKRLRDWRDDHTQVSLQQS